MGGSFSISGQKSKAGEEIGHVSDIHNQDKDIEIVNLDDNHNDLDDVKIMNFDPDQEELTEVITPEIKKKSR